MDSIANHVASYANLLRDFAHHLFLRIKHYFLRQEEEEEEEEDDDDDHDDDDDGGGGDELAERSTMKDESGGQVVSRDDDIEVVMTRLGMTAARGGGGAIIDELLEEKTASLEELKRAFGVFDKNEDGFISGGELWCVMRRLGLREGLRLEDCDRMIRAFDEDGDGRVNFEDFTRLMEDSP